MKLLRIIRLDPSDTFIFERPAEPGEWAVSGAFAFWDRNPMTLEGKARTAFRSGFLGVESFGRSTLAQIVEASAEDRAQLVDLLARRLIEHCGAPDMAAARAAAAEEVTFAESLASEPQDTLIAVHRSYEDGAVRESFRTLRPREGARPARAFSFMEVVGDDESKDAAADRVDLISIAERERK